MTSSNIVSDPIFPAPWRISQISSTSIEAANGNGVASAGGFFNNALDAEQLHHDKNANARLIAAAPELLEALRELDRVYETGDFHSEFKPALEKARAAIAKAEGKQ